MKKLTIFLFIIPLFVNAQYQIKGKITDIENNTPIPFATVVLIDTYQGTMADTNGHFDFCISDTINIYNFEISALGYYKKQISKENLTEVIQLEKQIYELSSITIHSKKTKTRTKKLGVNIHAPKTSSFGTCSQLCLQAVLYIPNDCHIKGWIKSISYHIKKDRGIPNTPFRVRIFEKSDTLMQPGMDILNQSIIISGNKNGGWVTVYIDSLHIPFGTNGVFVGMEWLNDKTKYHYKSMSQSDTIDCFGQSISITNTISEHRTWMRDLFHKEWRLRDWWYSNREKTKPNNIMARIEIEYYK